MISPARAARRANLRRLLAPRSVALVGGQTLEPSIEMLRRAGFGGAIRVVNPFRREIGGIACLPSVADLPEPPDAAFLGVNRNLTVQVVRDLAALGAGGARFVTGSRKCFTTSYSTPSSSSSHRMRCERE